MTEPLVSVLLPIYNCIDYLPQAVDSCLTQEGVEFELLVVDDGSTDQSAAYIESLGDPRIRLIRMEKNRGLPVALNVGIEEARGRFIARMDGDDLSMPGRLKAQSDHLTATGAVLVGGNWETIDTDGFVWGSYQRRDDPQAIHDLIMTPANAFPHGTFMFPRQVVRDIGGYNEKFRYSQDLEIMVRLAHKGEVRSVEQVVYRHRAVPFSLYKANCHRVFTRLIKERATGPEPVEIATGEIESIPKPDQKAEQANRAEYLVRLGTYFMNSNPSRARYWLSRGLAETHDWPARFKAGYLIGRSALGVIKKRLNSGARR